MMPVYNEEVTLREIVRRVFDADLDLDREIVAVDDGSTDGSLGVLNDLADNVYRDRLKVFRLDRNRGKGAAIREGFRHVTGDVVIVQDADLEYDPADYRQLLVPLLDGRADVVFGSRFLGGGPHRVHLFWHYVGNKLLTTFANALYNVNLTDMETCYKAFRADVVAALKLRSDGFAIEPEMTAKVCKRGYRIYEVPVSYSGRSYAEGKKITWRDGVRALLAVFKYRFVD